MQVVSEEKALAALGRIRKGATLTDERKRLGLGGSQPLRHR